MKIIRATDDPMTVFFYLLFRDHVLSGDAENILRMLRDKTHEDAKAPSGGYILSNSFLADYARDFVARIRELSLKAEEPK